MSDTTNRTVLISQEGAVRILTNRATSSAPAAT